MQLTLFIFFKQHQHTSTGLRYLNAMSRVTWILQDYVAHSGDVSCLCLGRHSGQVMATGGKDLKVNIWALNKPNCLMSLSGHDSEIRSVRFNSSELRVAAGSSSGALKIWDLEAAKLTHTFTSHKAAVQTIEFHAYGEFAASGSADHNIKLWDLKRKGCIQTYKGHNAAVTCVRFSPDGRWLASADDSGVVKIWNMADHKQICEFKDHTAAINSLEFHPSELLLATCSSDRTIKMWDLDKMTLLCDIQGDGTPFKTILFHPEGMCVYGVGEKSLFINGWEPVQCYSTVELKCTNVVDLVVSQNQLVGAGFNQNKVTSFVVDIQKIPPIGDTIGSPSVVGCGSGRKTFIGHIAPSDQAKKPKNMAGGGDEDDCRMNMVDIKDVDYRKVIGKIDQLKPFEPPPDNGAGVVPDRNKVAGNEYNLKNYPDRSESEIMQYLTQGHGGITSVLSSRSRNLRFVKTEWTTNSIKSGIEMAIGLNDPSSLVDILHVLLSDVRLWNLDICKSLLPELADLLHSKYEEHMHISLSTLRLVVHTFGPVIKSNISSPPSPDQVDISRQDRYYKCVSCNKELSRIHDDLERMMSKVSQQGRLGQKVREIHNLISQMK